MLFPGSVAIKRIKFDISWNMNTFKILSCFRQHSPSLMLTKLSMWTALSREGSRTTLSLCSGTTNSSWQTTTGR